MPHKHKRVRTSKDKDFFELPPSSFAQPLPAFVKSKNSARSTPRLPDISSNSKPELSTKRKRSAQDNDDTPRAFKRLMSGYRPPRAGLDDGDKRKVISKNKQKAKTALSTAEKSSTFQPSTDTVSSTSHLKPLPGESASAFSARVNAALPILALRNRQSKNSVPGLKERETKLEKRKKRMRAQWWEEEKKIKEKIEEAEEEMREKIESMGGGAYVDYINAPRAKKRKGKKRASGEDGEVEDEGDIWAQIGKKTYSAEDPAPAPTIATIYGKAAEETKGLIGVHDVVSAPPKFSKHLTAKMKDAGLKSNKGNAEGGLKRKVELGQARRQVIEGYRAIMKDKGREAITT